MGVLKCFFVAAFVHFAALCEPARVSVVLCSHYLQLEKSSGLMQELEGSVGIVISLLALPLCLLADIKLGFKGVFEQWLSRAYCAF